MGKNNLYLLLLFISISAVFGQETKVIKDSIIATEVSDGPYIFIENNKLIEKVITNGIVSSKILPTNTYDTIYTPDKSSFNNIKDIAVFSDIHGQYDLAIEILKNNKILDKNLNWNFGKGHLVIVGDIFDRGDKVNEMLWLVYKLEAQAKSKGGGVHFLLGNHEYMVLHKDLRYINEKYKVTSKLLNLEYDELYSDKTVLGRWLRSKATIIKVNDDVYVHGGVSEDFIAKNNMNFDALNEIMRKSIDKTKAEMKATDFYKTYYGSKSLIWYRGYFTDNLTEADISRILKQLNSEHIVVGHCSNAEVIQLFNYKIFGVDSSIKNGKYGEILFIKNKKYFRGTLKGKQIPLKKMPTPYDDNN